jgi:hypothetical protein
MELTSTFRQRTDGRTRLSKVFCGIDWAENHVRHEALEVERG